MNESIFNSSNDSHCSNIDAIFVTLDVLNLDKFNFLINLHLLNIEGISITSLVLVGHEDSKEYLGSQDFSDIKNTYTVTVPNRVKNVDLSIQVEDIADAFGPGATVRYINEKGK